jgi:tRNA dimethylallyltransferase
VKALYEKEGVGALQAELEVSDPAYYAIVDKQNPQRLMRALEVCRFTGKTFSSFRKGEKTKRPFEIIKVGLNIERALLYKRIDHRMDLMVGAGLFQEAEALAPHQHLNALQTVGYREIYGYTNGDYDKEEALRLLKRNSRRYAKRQLTWFKKDTETQWFTSDALDQVIAFVDSEMKSERSEAEN